MSKVMVHKVTILIVDHDAVGRTPDGIRNVIENTRCPNHCIAPHVMQVETVGVKWSDEHPLNNYDTQREEFERLFPGSGDKS